AAERQGDRDVQQEAARGELERGREPADQIAPHRLTGGQGLPEVSPRKIPYVETKLNGQALVEAEAAADLLDGLPGGGGTCEEGRGVTRQCPRQEERDHDDPGEAGSGRQEPPPDQPQHGRASVLRELPEVELPVEPVLVAGDPL